MKLKLPPHAALDLIRRNLFWFLLLAYAVATFFPGPGNAFRKTALGELPFSGDPLNPMHLLLGTLLFSVGTSMRLTASGGLSGIRRFALAALAGSWILPLAGLGVIAAVCGPFLSTEAWGAFLVGAAVVVAMPPANSASVWSELSGGSAAATVAVIVLGTLLCPLATPLALGLIASTASPVQLTAAEMAGSLEVLTAFVVLPAAAGMALRHLIESMQPERMPRLLTAVRSVAVLSLLTLNYANAAAALPRLTTTTLFSESAGIAALSVVLCGVVFVLSNLTSRLAGWPRAQAVSFVYVAGMKNTGAALVLATSALAVHPQAVLAPVFYTIAQHVAAAAMDRRETRRKLAMHALAAGVSLPLPEPHAATAEERSEPAGSFGSLARRPA